MHFYVLVYGSVREIRQEIANIEISMQSHGYGEVRQIQLLEIIFPQEKQKEVETLLSQPSGDIENLVASSGLRDIIETVTVKGQPVTPIIDKRINILGFKSPSCNIIASKQDNKYPDNREIM
jgi:hypothetical protein